MSNGSTEFYTRQGIAGDEAKKLSKLARKKERIYVIAAALTSINNLTWIQILYNDPSVAESRSLKEWLVLAGISAASVAASTLVTWLAYLSDPTATLKATEKKDDVTPLETAVK